MFYINVFVNSLSQIIVSQPYLALRGTRRRRDLPLFPGFVGNVATSHLTGSLGLLAWLLLPLGGSANLTLLVVLQSARSNICRVYFRMFKALGLASFIPGW